MFFIFVQFDLHLLRKEDRGEISTWVAIKRFISGEKITQRFWLNAKYLFKKSCRADLADS